MSGRGALPGMVLLNSISKIVFKRISWHENFNSVLISYCSLRCFYFEKYFCFFRLECQVDSHPPPLITWFVNGMEVKPSPHYEIRYEDGKSILLIIEVGPQDTGEYTCKAVSEIGEAVSSTTLYVQGRE